MDARVRQALEGTLRDSRAALLERAGDEEADLALIAAERAVELEERAQDERTARLIARLDDQTRREIVEINAALDRLIDGSYGCCTSCDQPIVVARLRVLPATALCLACAEQAERRHVRSGSSRRIALPPDLGALSNREIEELVRRTVREDRRIDDDDLQIHYRRGVLRLAGTVSSEAQHTALSALLDDVFGIHEVVDRVDVRAPPP